MTAWITNADLIAWLPALTTPDATQLGLVASDAVRSYLERELVLAAYAEIYDSNGTDYILLNHWPVRSIESVSINGGAPLPPAAFNVRGWRLDPFVPRKLQFPGQGKIARGFSNIPVSYHAGYDITQTPGSATGLPADVWQALRLTAAAVYNSQAADPNLTSESTGGVFSGSFAATGVGAVPPGAMTLLQRFKRTSA